MRTFEYGLIDRQTTTAVFDGHYGLDFIETFLEKGRNRALNVGRGRGR